MCTKIIETLFLPLVIIKWHHLMKNTNKWMNRMFCIFLFIFCKVANHFVAVHKIQVVKDIVPVVECLNIINLYAFYDPATGPEQQIYVVLWVQYERKKGGKDQERFNQVPHLTQNTKWECNNHTIQHHKREPRGKPFPSRWPQGTNEQKQKHG